MPAFYDSNGLQIAFEHVWKQLFDENIPDLAFTANRIGRLRFGVTDFVTKFLNNGHSLLGTFYTIAPVPVPPIVARYFDINTQVL